MPSLNFPSKERLKSKKHIALLFKSGQSMAAFPVLGIYRTDANPKTVISVAFTVPKKHFKRAVDRNLIKRRMKESWRLHKDSLIKDLESHNLSIQIIVIYLGKEILEFKKIDKGTKKLLRKLHKQILT